MLLLNIVAAMLSQEPIAVPSESNAIRFLDVFGILNIAFLARNALKEQIETYSMSNPEWKSGGYFSVGVLRYHEEIDPYRILQLSEWKSDSSLITGNKGRSARPSGLTLKTRPKCHFLFHPRSFLHSPSTTKCESHCSPPQASHPTA